ncbi:lipoprotein 17-related variable surface protein [Mycoplasma bradburyae]|uniref:lipoprotein 17-related variable surface protein n=1 Tax=Mycoplasma bradburyae TaxID=2963128 RepID=UPI002341B5D3|nr:lipoprotein 17-related variable surface protein [Mycoplasma bradburyae]MDC4183944.1 hypothetical protein [Mycoplasma bradburyae]
MSSGGSDSMTSTGSTDSTGSTGTTTPEVNSKAAVQAYVDKLTDASFNLVNDMNQELDKKQTKVSDVNTTNIKLNDGSDPAIKGWMLSFELVPNNEGANADNGILKFKVKFTKGTDVVTSNEISISGFKTLQTSVAAVLLKNMDVKDSQNQSVSKKVLNLGSADFKKLSTLNAMNVIATPSGTTSSASAQTGPTTRDSGVTMPESQANPDGMSNQEKTTGLGAIFKTLVNNEGSEWKNQLAEIKKIYTDFNPENLYLSGQAKLVNLWKGEGDDWHGNYYLTSKEGDGNKLSIKYKGKDWSIDLTDGLVIQDLLPDSVKVYVSKIDNDLVSINDESNIDEYIKQIDAESKLMGTEKEKNGKYLYKDGLLTVKPTKVSRNDPDTKSVILNPIRVRNIPASLDVNKILFKAQYLFDGIGVFNGDIFGTNLKFKKALKWDTGYDNKALKSEYLANIWYGINYIPGQTSETINVGIIKRKGNLVESSFGGGGSNESEYFQKENLNKNIAIKGNSNNPDGEGVAQLIKNNDENSGRGIRDKRNQINSDKATNYVIFPRIYYKKSNLENQMYGYLWSETVTILHIDAPNS